MRWNDLTPAEEETRRKMKKEAWMKEEILRVLAETKTVCSHRWREEKGWTLPSTGDKRFYPLHPICLVCDESDELKWYCHESPRRTCLYRDGVTQVEAAGDGSDMGDCVYCGEPYQRSF